MTLTQSPSDELEWERAYQDFESPEQETAKFVRRLERLGIGPPSGELRVLELFAGRANGLSALSRLGFRRLFALDRSLRLLSASDWRQRACSGDARQLPYRSGSMDVVVVQGGLHHLESLPDDLDATLDEIARVLKPGGRLFVVEPARTPFLSIVHAICRLRLARRLSSRVDGLARMIELETPTYQRWLDQGEQTVDRLVARFEPVVCERDWGKLVFAGRVPGTAPTAPAKQKSGGAETAGILFVVLAQILALAVAAFRNRFSINPDAIAYLQIGRHLAEGRFDLAWNGYWGPLLSWIMAPMLALGVDRLVTARIALALSALLFLLGSIALFRAFGLRRMPLFMAATMVAAASIAWSVDAITPDLLAAGILMFALAKTFSAAWVVERRIQIVAGAVWALGYFAKAIVLPVGAAVVVAAAVITAFSIRRRSEAAIAASVTLATLLLVASPWLIALSVKYGKPTFSTTGPIAHALVGPPDLDRRNPLILSFRTPEPGRLLVSEDPSRLPFARWSPLEGDEYARHQVEIIQGNARIIAERIKAFDRFHIALWSLVIAGMAVLVRPSLVARYRWLLAPVPVVAAVILYLPVWANDARYYYFAFPLAVAIAVGSCSRAWSRWHLVGQLLLAVVAFSFLSPAVEAVRRTLDPPESLPAAAARELAGRLEALQITGPVAGSGNVEGSMAALYVSFFLDEPWVGDQAELDVHALAESDARLYLVSRSEGEIVRRVEQAGAFVRLDERLFSDAEAAARFPLVAFLRADPSGAAGSRTVVDDDNDEK